MIYEKLDVGNSDTKVFGIFRPARSCIDLNFLKISRHSFSESI